MGIFLKKALMLLGVTAFLSLFASTASFAVEPGCNPDFLKIQQNHSEAMRVRDKAYSRETIKRNDTAVGMTCFDQSMGLTSKLGLIFSDVLPDAPPAPNEEVFDVGLEYPNWGADDWLIEDLADVVDPVLSEYLNDYGDTLSDLLGLGTTLSDFSAIFGPIDAVISTVNGILAGFAGSIATLNGWLNTITTISSNLSLPLPQPAILAITAALDAAQSTIDAMMSAIQAAVSAAIMPIIGNITADIAAISMDCDRIAELWNGAAPVADAAPIEGAGMEAGTPYFSFEDLVNGAPAGVGPDLLDELSAGGNGGFLGAALADLTGPLAAPGALSSWKTAPVFPPGTGTAAIIGGM